MVQWKFVRSLWAGLYTASPHKPLPVFKLKVPAERGLLRAFRFNP